MILLSAPLEVWQNIIIDWLGTLRDAIRLDLACSIDHPIESLCKKLCFIFTDNGNTSQHVLAGLCDWLQSRHVYLNHIVFNEDCYADSVLLEWERLFLWCGERLTHLNIIFPESNSAVLLSWVLMYCPHIQDLSIGNIEADNGVLRKIVETYAETLVRLAIINCTVQPNEFLNLAIINEHLDVLRFECGNSGELASLQPLLLRSPELKTLYVELCDLSDVDITTIAESCPRLMHLVLNGLFNIKEEALLRIAQGCPNLEQLQIYDCVDDLTDHFVDVMSALPKLHYLEIAPYGLSENILLKIAARRAAPSLRVLAIGTSFTYSGFREFTAACPHLIGLEFFSSHMLLLDCSRSPTSQSINLFEHCKELQHLIFIDYRQAAARVEPLLDSLAKWCQHVTTLELAVGAEYCNAGVRALDAFLTGYPQLRRLVVTDCSDIQAPQCNPKLYITRQTIPLIEGVGSS